MLAPYILIWWFIGDAIQMQDFDSFKTCVEAKAYILQAYKAKPEELIDRRMLRDERINTSKRLVADCKTK